MDMSMQQERHTWHPRSGQHNIIMMSFMQRHIWHQLLLIPGIWIARLPTLQRMQPVSIMSTSCQHMLPVMWSIMPGHQ